MLKSMMVPYTDFSLAYAKKSVRDIDDVVSKHCHTYRGEWQVASGLQHAEKRENRAPVLASLAASTLDMWWNICNIMSFLGSISCSTHAVPGLFPHFPVCGVASL